MAEETRLRIEDNDRGYAFELIQKSVSANVACQYEKIIYRDGKVLSKELCVVNININGNVDTPEGVAQLKQQDPRAMELSGLAMEKMAEGYVFDPEVAAREVAKVAASTTAK